MARSTRGWQWPTETVTIPAKASRYLKRGKEKRKKRKKEKRKKGKKGRFIRSEVEEKRKEKRRLSSGERKKEPLSHLFPFSSKRYCMCPSVIMTGSLKWWNIAVVFGARKKERDDGLRPTASEKLFPLSFSLYLSLSFGAPSPFSSFFSLTGAQVLLAEAEDLGGRGAGVGRRGEGAGRHHRR